MTDVLNAQTDNPGLVVENGFNLNAYRKWPSARDISIYMSHSSGSKLAELGREYRLSPARIKQICVKIYNTMKYYKGFAEFIELGKPPPKPKIMMEFRTLSVLMQNGFIDPVIGVQLNKIATQTKADLLKLPNCGRKTLNEIKEILKENGLTLRDEEGQIND